MGNWREYMKARWKVWSDIIGYFLICLLSFVVSTVIFMFIPLFTKGEFSLDSDLNMNRITIVGMVICLVIYMFIIRRNKKMSLWEYCRVRKLRFSDVLLAIGLGIILNIGISFLIQLDMMQQLITEHDAKISRNVYDDSIFVIMLVTGILAPFLEEMLFRGLLYQTLKKYYSMAITIVIQATIFAVIHVNPLQMLYTFILALLLVWLLESANSLWAAIIMHMSFNLTTIVLLRIVQEKESLLLFLVLVSFAVVSFLIGIATRLKKKQTVVNRSAM